jgi:uncharacterized protein (TIGR02145 family)
MNSILKFTVLLAGLAAAELPLKVRADQALSQLQANIQANNFAGALPWLEKAVALEAEGYKLPSGMGFFAGQVYVKNGEKPKAVPYLEAYVNQPAPGKYFWEAVQLLCQASPSKGKAYLETYLAQNNPPYYQQALALYTQIESLAKADAERIAQEEALDARLASYRGIMTDSRDGKTYKTIQIGSQVWMAENLNYSTGNSWCYDNNGGNCAKWGRLYDWQTAKNACPSGWHLPSDEQWHVLDKDQNQGDKTSGKALKSLGMGGSNLTGFNALPGGNHYPDGSFVNARRKACFWCSEENNAGSAWRRCYYEGNERMSRFNAGGPDGLSVRCLKD